MGASIGFLLREGSLVGAVIGARGRMGKEGGQIPKHGLGRGPVRLGPKSPQFIQAAIEGSIMFRMGDPEK